MIVDASGLFTLSRDIGELGAKSGRVMYAVFKESGEDVRDAWKHNAKASAGKHGKHYPDAITMDMRVGLNIEAEIGPNSALPQGGMSFEFGSVNQPPHLDGQRAADEKVPLIDRRIDAALAHLGL